VTYLVLLVLLLLLLLLLLLGAGCCWLITTYYLLRIPYLLFAIAIAICLLVLVGGCALGSWPPLALGSCWFLVVAWLSRSKCLH
jgi:hypothetical protein